MSAVLIHQKLQGLGALSLSCHKLVMSSHASDAAAPVA